MRKSHTAITRHQEDKQSKVTSSFFPIEMTAKLEWTQSTAQQNIEQSHNGSNNQQCINNNRTTALERTAAKGTGVQGGGGVNAFYWYQIFALDSSVVVLLKHKNIELEKRAHDSQIVRAKENLKLSHGGHRYSQSPLILLKCVGGNTIYILLPFNFLFESNQTILK